MEHLIHFFILSAGLVLGLVIWFWDALINNAFSKKTINLRSWVILTLVFFAVFHVSPASLLMSYHHQSADHGISHPCCMPQVATVVPTLAIVLPQITTEKFGEWVVSSQARPTLISLNSRPPPNS